MLAKLDCHRDDPEEVSLQPMGVTDTQGLYYYRLWTLNFAKCQSVRDP